MSTDVIASPLPTATPSLPDGSGRSGVPATALANPFGALLAGLDAVQSPSAAAPSMTSGITPGQLAATTQPLVSVDFAQTAAATQSVDSLDTPAAPPAPEAPRIFLGPAFNRRLAPLPADLAGPAPGLSPATDAVAIPTPASLAALLAARSSRMSVSPVAAGDAQENLAALQTAELQDAQPVTAAVAQADVRAPQSSAAAELLSLQTSGEPVCTADASCDVPDSDVEDAEDEDVACGTPLVAQVLTPPVPSVAPALPAPAHDGAPPSADAQTEDLLPAGDTNTNGRARIALFDRLAQGMKPDAEKVDAAHVSADTASEPEVLALPQAPDLQKAPAPDNMPLRAADPAPADSIAPAPAQVAQVTLRPHTPAQLVEGVSVLVTRAAKSSINEFLIRLDPPELGRIDVQLKMHDDGTVQAVIASDSASTHDLLRREASTLERALSDSGFRTGNEGLSFSLKQQGGEQQRGHPPANGVPHAPADQAVPDETLPAAVLAPLRQRYENARVNISA